MNIDIKIKCTGLPLEALNETVLIAKCIKSHVYLQFDNFKITVFPDSNIQDLFEIYCLNEKIKGK